MWMETFKANMWIIECVVIKRSRKTSELRGIYSSFWLQFIWNFGNYLEKCLVSSTNLEKIYTSPGPSL